MQRTFTPIVGIAAVLSVVGASPVAAGIILNEPFGFTSTGDPVIVESTRDLYFVNPSVAFAFFDVFIVAEGPEGQIEIPENDLGVNSPGLSLSAGGLRYNPSLIIPLADEVRIIGSAGSLSLRSELVRTELIPKKYGHESLGYYRLEMEALELRAFDFGGDVYQTLGFRVEGFLINGFPAPSSAAALGAGALFALNRRRR